MKLLTALYWCLLSFTGVWAQDIDEDKMDRDIKIAEDIINSLLKQEGNTGGILRSPEVIGNYVQEYGVIFNINIRGKGWPIGIRIGDSDDEQFRISDHINIPGNQYYAYHGDDIDEILQAKDEYLEQVMETFLVDYADLIGQLNPDQKIMLKSQNLAPGVLIIGGGKGYRFSWNRNHEDVEGNHEDDGDHEDEDDDEDEYKVDGDRANHYVLTAEVRKSDINAYKSGRIDRDELVERIVFEKDDSPTENEPQLDLLATIFRRLYKSDLSETYFATRSPQYDRIANFGVIYNWRVYSSNVDDDRHNMPTLDLYNLDTEERNRKVEVLYPKFKEQFRSHLVEYGRTLKDLEGDDVVMFKIKMTQCEGCSVPKSVDFSVKRSVLEDYEKQNISLQAAAQKVSVREHMED